MRPRFGWIPALAGLALATLLPAAAQARRPDCGAHALDHARLRCGGSAGAHALCGERVYRLRPLVERCGFPAAVRAVLGDTWGGRFPARSARVLWLEPGGDYRVAEPVTIDVPGTVLLGAGAPVPLDGPADWERGGSVVRCEVGPGAACLTLVGGADDEEPGGFRVEGLTFMGTAGAGLRIERATGVSVRDVSFRDLAGDALVAVGVASSRFEGLRFESTDGGAGAALAFDCQRDPETGALALCPNGNTIAAVTVDGYATGVHYVGGNSVTIRDGVFTSVRGSALVLDGNESLRVEGCRFSDGFTGPPDEEAWIRIERQRGWWYPDVVLSGLYFQCRCQGGRVPVVARVAGTATTPFPRVALLDSTFRDCAGGPLRQDDPRTVWQCQRNRVVQRVQTGPSVYEGYVLDTCATPEDLPPHPQSCR